jgi:hypothetical protein
MRSGDERVCRMSEHLCRKQIEPVRTAKWRITCPNGSRTKI